MNRFLSLLSGAALTMLPALAQAQQASGDSLDHYRPIPPEEPRGDRYGWWVPDYAKLQTGGFIGTFTLAIGYSAFADILNVQVSYGYAIEGDTVDTHLFTGLVIARPVHLYFGNRADFGWVPLYLGGGAMVADNSRLFVSQPDVYPAGYYPPTAFHWMALLGTELSIAAPPRNFFARHALFVEEVTFDQYLDAMLGNRALHLFDGFSTAIGYRASF